MKLQLVHNKNILFVIIIIFLIPLVITFQNLINSDREGESNKDHTIYIPDTKFIKIIDLGFDQFVADIYWLKTVQYIGDKYWIKKGYPHLYKMINLVTDLSPKFNYPYQVGGVVLSNYVHRFSEGNALLEKGYKENPEVWQIPFYLGFNYFFYLNDYNNAAKYMEMASHIPGRPAYLPLLVSRLYAQSDNPETAIEFLQRVYENTTDDKTKELIIQRIKDVKSNKIRIFKKE